MLQEMGHGLDGHRQGLCLVLRVCYVHHLAIVSGAAACQWDAHVAGLWLAMQHTAQDPHVGV